MELFRRRLDLARELLRAARGIELPGELAEAGSIDFSQVVPTEYRADQVTLLRDRDRTVLAAVIVEIQRDRDDRKPWTWPVYVAAARAKHRCPVVLLVIAPDPVTAAWARRPLDTGHPGFVLIPVVLGYGDIPRITDVEVAEASPELAVLSALAHPELEVAAAALGAIRTLADESSALYSDVILAALPSMVRQALEATVKGYVYQSEFAIKHQAIGLEQGKRNIVLSLLRAKLDHVPGDAEERLAALAHEALDSLAVAIGLARDADEVLIAFDRATAPS